VESIAVIFACASFLFISRVSDVVFIRTRLMIPRGDASAFSRPQ
jgi:hypothetical protein